MRVLDIAEVARLTGLPASTLRYYEEKRLITSIGRRGLRRLFSADVMEVLDVIALAKWAGFTLDEVRGWIARDGSLQMDRSGLARRAEEIDALAERLRALSEMVRHTARCPHETHFDCPSFRRLLAEARARQISARMPGAAADGSLSVPGQGDLA
jgi:DNA-binding transcriptional MerR regulator